MARPSSPSPPASARKRSRSPPEAAAKHDPRPAAAAAATATAAAASPAGFIFMCNGATKPECYRHRVLGLPRGRLDAVSRIRRGAAVFLYDFDARYLYGPYQADSDGGLHLVPAAFHGRFPAQVKFKIDGDFMPLPESSLRSAINDNYVNGRFNPELTATQVEKLRALFQPITLLPESAPRHDVDNRPPPPLGVDNWLPPPHDVDNWPPAPPLLPPSANPVQPPAYAHHPTPYIAPPDAHSMPPEAYPPPCPYLPPTAPGMVTETGYGYGDGYEAYRPFHSAYRYVQTPPSCSLYAQYPMPAHVSGPAYSTGPYYAPYQNHPYPYEHGSVNHHYQQSTYERAPYYGSGWGFPR
ncbi:uncharacterized protein [Miscanthus floridulus]|uniref:uncharacterized protein n=1 Tax=Miscanthus floridulus TaxID=154761 RepID=UPI003457A904